MSSRCAPTLNDGEFVLLCGESGCGKTTLTRLVNGLIPHFVKGVKVDGAVTVEALDIAESPMYKIAESVGSVFQNPKTQFFNTNSSAEIAFGLENIGADLDFMHKRVAKTISDLEIETLADRSVFSLSGGEKQLLAFASVYAMNPQVYVLDEPSANLDHEAMGKLHKILETVKKGGHTVLIAKHRLSYLYGLADRIVYLKAGCIERVFTAAEFVGLSESERIAMGLRSICSEKISIPERTFMQPDSSPAVCHLSVKRKKQPRQLRRTAPFAYVKTLTRTAGGRPVVAIQLGCGSTKVMLTGTHHANESITGTLLWELLLRYCRAICCDGTFGGISARALYRNSMLYCVPLVNPDGADLVAGEIPESAAEYRQAAAIAAAYPALPIPSGWKANLRGIDLNLNYPASWQTAKEIKAARGFDRPAPRDYPGSRPLDQRETAALAAYTACVRPDLLLAYHTQGRVIYPGNVETEPPGAGALAAKFSEASGYAVEQVPLESANAGYKDWFLARVHRPGFTIGAGLGENPLELSQLPQLLLENEPLLAAALGQ